MVKEQSIRQMKQKKKDFFENLTKTQNETARVHELKHEAKRKNIPSPPYHAHNRLFISYDNFLDVDLIKQIKALVNKVYVEHQPVWRTSYDWPKEIRRATKPISILELPVKFCDLIHDRLNKTVVKWKKDTPPHKAMYYAYPPGGYIGWHDDSIYEFNATICLNQIWNVDWGGLHLYEDLKGLGIRAEVPTFNRCLISAGGVPHSTSIVTPDAPLREVISLFGGKITSKKALAEREKNAIEWRKKRNTKARYIEDPDLADLAIAAKKVR